jgi:small-conductance mechanosensitive channel
MKDLLQDKGFQRLVILFVLTTLLVVVMNGFLTDNGADPIVIGAGNIIIFLASAFTLLMYGRAKRSKSSHGFSKNVYAAFVTKFFVLITAAMLYFYFAQEISTKAVFVCLGLYFAYHFIGASYAARVEKKKVAHKH